MHRLCAGGLLRTWLTAASSRRMMKMQALWAEGLAPVATVNATAKPMPSAQRTARATGVWPRKAVALRTIM